MVLSVENGFNYLMLPYFGETEEDNWLLTYPIYQVAVNKDVEKDPVKKAVVMKVPDAIFSNEGQAMTANAFDDDRRAAAECGMNGFLSKPINMKDVIQTMQSLFDSE